MFFFCSKYLYSFIAIICVHNRFLISKKSTNASINVSVSDSKYGEVSENIFGSLDHKKEGPIKIIFTLMCAITSVQKKSCVNKIKVSTAYVPTIANIY